MAAYRFGDLEVTADMTPGVRCGFESVERKTL
jgi:hypothetical protein